MESRRSTERLEEQFEQLVTAWKAHCESPEVQSSSDVDAYLECSAYDEIVAMGIPALPLIRDHFAGNAEEAFFPIRGWALAVREITGGELEIPDGKSTDVDETRELVIDWLDKNMQDGARMVISEDYANELLDRLHQCKANLENRGHDSGLDSVIRALEEIEGGNPNPSAFPDPSVLVGDVNRFVSLAQSTEEMRQ